MTQTVQLIDGTRNVVAVAQVTQEDGLFSGPVDLQSMPAPMRAKFDEFEEIVNSQSFSLLDQIEDDIDRFGLKVAFSEGATHALADLQIYPRGKVLSFKLPASPMAMNKTSANGVAVNRATNN